MEEEICFKSLFDAAEKAKAIMKVRPSTKESEEFYGFKPDLSESEEIIHNALLGTIRDISMDIDSRYEFMHQALENIISDCDDDSDDDDALEKVSDWADADTDTYTSDLTKWLSRSVDNVLYLDEALEDGVDIDDGFKLLQMAQYKARDEVYTATIRALEELVDEYPCEDEDDSDEDATT